MKIWVVGSSYAGLILAEKLKQNGSDVSLVELPNQKAENDRSDALLWFSDSPFSEIQTRTVLLEKAKNLGILETKKFQGLTNKGLALADAAGAVSYLPIEDCIIVDATEGARVVVNQINNTPNSPPVTEVERMGINPFQTHLYAYIQPVEKQFPILEELKNRNQDVSKKILLLEKLRALGWQSFIEPDLLYNAEKKVISAEVPSGLAEKDYETWFKILVELKTGFENPQLSIKTDLPYGKFTVDPCAVVLTFIPANPNKDRPIVIPFGGAERQWPYALHSETHGLMQRLALLEKLLSHEKEGSLVLEKNAEEYQKNIDKIGVEENLEVSDFFLKKQDIITLSAQKYEASCKAAYTIASEAEKAAMDKSIEYAKRVVKALKLHVNIEKELKKLKNKEMDLVEAKLSVENILKWMIKASDMIPEDTSEKFCLHVYFEEVAMSLLAISKKSYESEENNKRNLKALESILKSSLVMFEKFNVIGIKGTKFQVYYYLANFMQNLSNTDDALSWCKKGLDELEILAFTSEKRFNLWSMLKNIEVATMANFVSEATNKAVDKKHIDPEVLEKCEKFISEIDKILPYLKAKSNTKETTQIIEENLKINRHILSEFRLFNNIKNTSDNNKFLSKERFKTDTRKNVNPNNPAFRAKEKMTPPSAAKSAGKGKKGKQEGNRNAAPVVDIAPEKDVLLTKAAKLKQNIAEERGEIMSTTEPLLSSYAAEVEDPKQFAEKCLKYAKPDATATVRVAQMILRSVETNEKNIQGDIKKYEQHLSNCIQKLEIIQNNLQDPALNRDSLKNLDQEFDKAQKEWLENRFAAPIKRHIEKIAEVLDGLASNLSTNAMREGVRFISSSPTTTVPETTLPENELGNINITPFNEDDNNSQKEVEKKSDAIAASTVKPVSEKTSPSDNNNAVQIVRTSGSLNYTDFLSDASAYLPEKEDAGTFFSYKKSYHANLTSEQLSRYLRNEALALSARIQDFDNYKPLSEDKYDMEIFKNALAYNISKLFVTLWELDFAIRFAGSDASRSSVFKEWRDRFAHLLDYLPLTDLKNLAVHLRRHYVNHIFNMPLSERKNFTPEELLNIFPKDDYMKKIYETLTRENMRRRAAPRPLEVCAEDFLTALETFKKIGKGIDKVDATQYNKNPDIRDALKMLLAKMGDALQELELRQREHGGEVWLRLKATYQEVIPSIILARNKIFHRVQQDLDVGSLLQIHNKLRDIAVIPSPRSSINRPQRPAARP